MLFPRRGNKVPGPKRRGGAPQGNFGGFRGALPLHPRGRTNQNQGPNPTESVRGGPAGGPPFPRKGWGVERAQAGTREMVSWDRVRRGDIQSLLRFFDRPLRLPPKTLRPPSKSPKEGGFTPPPPRAPPEGEAGVARFQPTSPPFFPDAPSPSSSPAPGGPLGGHEGGSGTRFGASFICPPRRGPHDRPFLGVPPGPRVNWGFPPRLS